jgi:hypothetical protein
LAVKNAAQDALDGTQDGQVELLFEADEYSKDHSTLEITTAASTIHVGGVEKHHAEVVVRDGNDNPISGVEVVFQWTLGDKDGPFADDQWNTVPTTTSNQSGVAVYEYPAPNNQAVWVWLRAFAYPDGQAEAVGAAETVPAYGQALKGARFWPWNPDTTETSATFEVSSATILNNMTDWSWARVVVTDQYGNGVGGKNVTFTLPVSQPDTDGTPVFVEGFSPPTAKTVVVTSCDYDLSTVPEECLLDGVYTPGLALVRIVSEFEGTFPASARADLGLGVQSLGSGPVKFDAGVGSAQASSFTLEPTAGQPVVANGVASYTLVVTVMNGEEGASLLPVAGECVTPTLPAGVSVADPGPPGTCDPGSFVTGNDGKVTLAIVSGSSGVKAIGAKLGGASGTPIPTVADGPDYSRDGLYVGGPPSPVESELTSPPSPARADSPLGQTVNVTLYDANRNLASCWSGTTQIPCTINVSVPDGAWVGSGPSQVSGPGWLTSVPAGTVDYTLATPLPGEASASVTFYGVEGTYDVEATVTGLPIELADNARVGPGQAAKARIRFTDSTPPGEPDVEPSNGEVIEGHVADDDLDDAANGDLEVVIKDEDGNEITRCAVEADGSFSCNIPAQEDGTELQVVIEDPAGNQTDPPVQVITDGVPPGTPVVDPSRGGEITGHVPDDDLADAANDNLIVVVVDPVTGDELCRSKVAADGSFRCEPDVPLEHGDQVHVVVIDPAKNPSPPLLIVVDAEAPLTPVPQPSDGTTISGKGDVAGDKITIEDKDGVVLCETTVGANLAWTCTLDPAAAEGDMLNIIEEDAAHNTVVKAWRVGIPEITMAKQTLCVSEQQAVTAKNFQPGETVTAVLVGSGLVATQVADSNGQVTFNWTVAKSVSQDNHVLSLTGAESGTHTANFTVYCKAPEKLVFTGANGVVGLAGGALGMLLAGWFLLLAAKRRKKEQEAREAAI